MTDRRKKQLLTALLAVFILMFAYRLLHPFEQERVAELTYTGQNRPGEEADAGNTALRPEFQVMLSLFREPPEHDGDVRNPDFFQPVPGLATPPPEPAPPPETAAPAEEETPAEEDPYVVVYEELGRLKVMGLYTSGDDRVIFFQRGKQSLVIREGDRIDGKYLVESITPDEITLRAEHLEDTVHIDLKQFLKPYERNKLSNGEQ